MELTRRSFIGSLTALAGACLLPLSVLRKPPMKFRFIVPNFTLSHFQEFSAAQDCRNSLPFHGHPVGSVRLAEMEAKRVNDTDWEVCCQFTEHKPFVIEHSGKRYTYELYAEYDMNQIIPRTA